MYVHIYMVKYVTERGTRTEREREREIKMSGTCKVCRAETLLEVHLKGE